MKIALDAMGGDFAPEQIVAGGVQAHRELGVDVIFVGVKDRVDAALAASGAGKWAQIEEAPEVIAMDEHPAQAVRSKKASSIVRGIQMVEDGRANGFVSAGNSGAVMAAALFGLHRIAGIDRPAIGSIIPAAGGKNCFLLDVGANTDAKPEHLLQYAVMGGIYAEKLMGVASPRVAQLSNGEEAGKGNQLVQAAERLLRVQPGINFIGNVEGKDIFRGKADVVVTDGFSGNVLIKTAEGAAEFVFQSVRDAVQGDPLASLGGLLIRPKLRAVRRRADWREFGGALLLGVNGVAVIAHGRSDARAIYNAVRVARDAVDQKVVPTIAAAVPSMTVQPQPSAPKSAPFVT
ncbi:MAG: phosphate acyltransferase PlsX [Chloroflexi bacterium]|nr:MAG: phosphate acyltransferase PlsX [Chloroflexota bacterium]TMF46124.1 MAG: phosphate acyltransferase PlsX [Chloroflexota bacterium]TMG49868.1 MAG: phosphate acyltransferase PlsX [Chloroflexota bacterium]